MTAKRRVSREHEIQAELMAWTLTARERHPELNLLFAIPNGGWRDWQTGKQLRKEGLKAGVPDLFLPVARHGAHGLFLEMKAPGGSASKEQLMWGEALAGMGYLVKICVGLEEAKNTLEDYLC